MGSSTAVYHPRLYAHGYPQGGNPRGRQYPPARHGSNHRRRPGYGHFYRNANLHAQPYAYPFAHADPFSYPDFYASAIAHAYPFSNAIPGANPFADPRPAQRRDSLYLLHQPDRPDMPD